MSKDNQWEINVLNLAEKTVISQSFGIFGCAERYSAGRERGYFLRVESDIPYVGRNDKKEIVTTSKKCRVFTNFILPERIPAERALLSNIPDLKDYTVYSLTYGEKPLLTIKEGDFNFVQEAMVVIHLAYKIQYENCQRVFRENPELLVKLTAIARRIRREQELERILTLELERSEIIETVFKKMRTKLD